MTGPLKCVIMKLHCICFGRLTYGHMDTWTNRKKINPSTFTEENFSLTKYFWFLQKKLSYIDKKLSEKTTLLVILKKFLSYSRESY